MTKIAIFADVQNIYYTTREAFGSQFNYRKLWQRINLQGDIIEATAYAIERGDDKQRQFQDALKHLGFTIKLKPFIQRKDGSAKGDWDVGITIDVLEAAPKVDEIVLLSGDGDFDLLLQTVSRKYQVKTRVFGVEALTANSLMRAASEFCPIDGSLLIN